jgi:hypothetical protein
MIDIPKEERTPIFHLLLKSFDLSDTIDKNQNINKEDFDLQKMKLTLLIDDLITFITDRELKDASIGDVKISW